MIKTQPSCKDIFESGLMPCEEALSRILANLPTINGYQRLPIEKSRGRTLYEAVVSTLNVPAHTNSAVDGYALHSSELPSEGIKRLAVKGLVLAGVPHQNVIEPGTCLRIMTGAALPEPFDTVLMQEHVEAEDGFIVIDNRHKAGDNVRRAGEDIKQGETVLAPGRYLMPPDIGLLASLGINEINVRRRLVVAIASTGNEIFAPFETPGEGGIYDSNRYSLLAALDRPDIEVVDLGIIEDDPDTLLKHFNEAGRYADLIISSGGVSVGEADFTKTALLNSGQVDFWKIAIKPGRPLAFGRIGNAAFFGLPGNPVAVLVTFYYFVLPALEQMLGFVDKPIAPTIIARTTEKLRKKPGRTEIQRGILSRDQNGDWIVRTTGKQGSGILMSMSKANAFIILNHQDTSKSAGDWVTVRPFCGMF